MPVAWMHLDLHLKVLNPDRATEESQRKVRIFNVFICFWSETHLIPGMLPINIFLI